MYVCVVFALCCWIVYCLAAASLALFLYNICEHTHRGRERDRQTQTDTERYKNREKR